MTLINCSRMHQFSKSSQLSPFPSPLFDVLQAVELAPALQADMEVKEAIQGAIQGENGEMVQIVTSVVTWEPLLVQHSPEFCSTARPDESRRWTNAHSLTSDWVRKHFQYWRLLITNRKEAFCSGFLFSPAISSVHCQPDVSMWNCSQKLEKDQDNPKFTVVSLAISSPEGHSPLQETQRDSVYPATYADHHLATSSTHMLVYINLGK